jgi:hypothetical protein
MFETKRASYMVGCIEKEFQIFPRMAFIVVLQRNLCMVAPVRKWTPERHAIGSHVCWLQPQQAWDQIASSSELVCSKQAPHPTSLQSLVPLAQW